MFDDIIKTPQERPVRHDQHWMLKQCKKCGMYRNKNIDFYQDTSSEDGLTDICKKCWSTTN